MSYDISLGLQNEDQLGSAVAEELTQLIAALQQQLSIPLSDIASLISDFQNPPRMRVFLPGNQTLADSTDTTLVFTTSRGGPNDIEEYDSHHMWDANINAVSIKTPGLYVLTAQIVWSGLSLVGTRSLVFTQTSGAIEMSRRLPGSVIYCLHTVPINVTQVMIDGGKAKFKLVATQSSGGNLDATSNSWFAAYRVAPYPAVV